MERLFQFLHVGSMFLMLDPTSYAACLMGSSISVSRLLREERIQCNDVLEGIMEGSVISQIMLDQFHIYNLYCLVHFGVYMYIYIL